MDNVVVAGFGNGSTPRADSVSYALRLAVTLGLVGVIGAVDYLTGLEIRIFPLYFAPVAYATAGLGARVGVAVSALCTCTWLFSSLAAGSRSPGWLLACNATLQMAACAVVALMIARLRLLLRHERDHARTDALTGLPNRRALHERAALELARLARGSAPLVVASMDLDRFKRVNDEKGHAAGDRLLRDVARIVHQRLRATDLLSRIGGDEFVLLLPDTTPADAHSVLDRVRRDVASELGATAPPVTASIGAVVIDAPGPVSFEEVLHLADMRLYEAKRAGRDQLRIVVTPHVRPVAAT